MNPTQNPSALRSKKEITDTLLALMKEYPYSEITVKHILLESQVSRKTFYRNFSSKDDVLRSYLDQMMEEYVKRIILGGDFNLLSVFNIIIDFSNDHKEMLLRLRDNKLFYLLLERWNINLPLAHQRLVKETNELTQEIDDQGIQYLIAFNIGAIWNVIGKWLENDMKDSTEALKEILSHYLKNIRLIDIHQI